MPMSNKYLQELFEQYENDTWRKSKKLYFGETYAGGEKEALMEISHRFGLAKFIGEDADAKNVINMLIDAFNGMIEFYKGEGRGYHNQDYCNGATFEYTDAIRLLRGLGV